MAAYDETVYQSGEQPPALVEECPDELAQLIAEAQALRDELPFAAWMYHELCGAIGLACYLDGWLGREADVRDRQMRGAVCDALRFQVDYAARHLAGLRAAEVGNDAE